MTQAYRQTADDVSPEHAGEEIQSLQRPHTPAGLCTRKVVGLLKALICDPDPGVAPRTDNKQSSASIHRQGSTFLASLSLTLVLSATRWIDRYRRLRCRAGMEGSAALRGVYIPHRIPLTLPAEGGCVDHSRQPTQSRRAGGVRDSCGTAKDRLRSNKMMCIQGSVAAAPQIQLAVSSVSGSAHVSILKPEYTATTWHLSLRMRLCIRFSLPRILVEL